MQGVWRRERPGTENWVDNAGEGKEKGKEKRKGRSMPGDRTRRKRMGMPLIREEPWSAKGGHGRKEMGLFHGAGLDTPGRFVID